MFKKRTIMPWYLRPVNPSPIISSLILTGAVMVAYNAVTACSRWYDRVVPGAIEKVEIAKMTADALEEDE